MTTRESSAAYAVLRISARRVDQLIQDEIVRQQDGCAVVYHDQLDGIGSRRRVWVLAMCELHALGLYEITRFPKRYICKASDRWRGMTIQEARIASVMAREHAGDSKPIRSKLNMTAADRQSRRKTVIERTTPHVTNIRGRDRTQRAYWRFYRAD